MAATLVTSNTFTFADGTAGHVCDLASAPTAGQVDVLCVNSNTTVSTPTGFTVAPSSVGGQGAYIFRRVAAGTEGTTVTITTNGNHNTSVIWSRWAGVNAVDTAVATPAGGTGATTPAHSTGALAATGELVIAFAALHGFTVTPTAPSWSAGYTPLALASLATGAGAVVGMVAYRTNAGTTAESPSVSWTNAANDRYMLTLTFTASASGATQNGNATLAGAASILATAAVSPSASASVTASATITATAAVTRSTSATVSVTATVTATAMLVDISPDMDITVGRPQTAWTVGPPRTGWSVKAPRDGWTIGRPR